MISHEADPAPDRPGTPRRRWLPRGVGLALVLMVLGSIALAFWLEYRRLNEYWQVQVVVTNKSNRVIKAVTIDHEGTTTPLGPLEPGAVIERRIRTERFEPIQIKYHLDVPGQSGLVEEVGSGAPIINHRADFRYDGP